MISRFSDSGVLYLKWVIRSWSFNYLICSAAHQCHLLIPRGISLGCYDILVRHWPQKCIHVFVRVFVSFSVFKFSVTEQWWPWAVTMQTTFDYQYFIKFLIKKIANLFTNLTLMRHVRYDWFPVILFKSWWVPHVWQEMRTLFGTPKFHSLLGVHRFIGTMFTDVLFSLISLTALLLNWIALLLYPK